MRSNKYREKVSSTAATCVDQHNVSGIRMLPLQNHAEEGTRRLTSVEYQNLFHLCHAPGRFSPRSTSLTIPSASSFP